MERDLGGNSGNIEIGQVDSELIFHMAQLKIWLWLKYIMKSFLYSFSVWVMDPIQCIKSCT